MNKQILILFYFLIYSQTTIHAQDLTAIIKNHETNLRDLYQTRGADAEWSSTGEVSIESIAFLLNSYQKNVVVLIYSHQNDTLTLNLISKKGLLATLNKKIQKEEIIKKVTNVSKLLTSKSSKNISELRGSISVDTKNKKSELENSYRELNNLLLPISLNLETFDHIIFVPIYNLTTLPFSALKINDDYLIDKMSFSIAPSLFELMVSKKINTKNHNYDEIYYYWNNALFVANPEYPKELNFKDLPGALNEVEQITNTLSPDTYKILTGNDATKSNIKENICDYDLLYFATHGVSNSENPLDHSFLVVAADENNNSFYTMKEIMNERYNCLLKANLVVLSACQTGLGKTHEGGIIGLARAFQIADANHVVMSLWSINDAETAKLMEFFFKELIKENSLQPHEALRTAIVKYKKEVNNDPKYWASFSIFGIPY